MANFSLSVSTTTCSKNFLGFMLITNRYLFIEAYAIEGNLDLFAEMVANPTELQLDCYLEMAEVARAR